MMSNSYKVMKLYLRNMEVTQLWYRSIYFFSVSLINFTGGCEGERENLDRSVDGTANEKPRSSHTLPHS